MSSVQLGREVGGVQWAVCSSDSRPKATLDIEVQPHNS